MSSTYFKTIKTVAELSPSNVINPTHKTTVRLGKSLRKKKQARPPWKSNQYGRGDTKRAVIHVTPEKEKNASRAPLLERLIGNFS